MKHTCKPGLLILLLLSVLLHGQETEDYKLDPQQLEVRLLDHVNQERSTRGLPPLEMDIRLSEVARGHSRKMAETRILSHTFPAYPPLAERLIPAGIFFARAGENVARSETFVMRLVHESLMDSPSHRTNILHPGFNHIGIGIVLHHDVYYITQVFARIFSPATPREQNRALTQTLETLLGKAFRPSLTGVPELETFSRTRAADFLQGRADPGLPDHWSWGRALLSTHSYLWPHEVSTRLAEEIRQHPKCLWVMGTAFERSPLHPGGSFATCLIRFPAPPGEKEQVRMILAQANQARKAVGMPSVEWSPRLADKAAVMLQKHLQNRKSRMRGYALARIYEVLDLEQLPPALINAFEQKEMKTIGASVLLPTHRHPFRNTLLVAILGR